MADKGLKGMSRGELLELLIAQMEENEKLQTQLEEAKARLKSRRINIDKAGSIAEASLLLNGVFQSAEDAAAQYLENIRMLQGRQKKICQQMEDEAKQKADAIVAEAESYSRKLKEETLVYCKQLVKKAQTVSGEK